MNGLSIVAELEVGLRHVVEAAVGAELTPTSPLHRLSGEGFR